MLRVTPAVLSFVISIGVATGCASTRGPELRVVGTRETQRQEIVFVQVTNPARRPMRLRKLEYTFASEGHAISTGELTLTRVVPAGAAVIVEVPMGAEIAAPDGGGPVTLRGKLTAELDQIVRVFGISAAVAP